jgi:hypothetical protein
VHNTHFTLSCWIAMLSNHYGCYGPAKGNWLVLVTIRCLDPQLQARPQAPACRASVRLGNMRSGVAPLVGWWWMAPLLAIGRRHRGGGQAGQFAEVKMVESTSAALCHNA